MTTPARTLLDFAEQAPLRDLERAYGEAVALRLTSPRQLSALMQRRGGRRGAPAIAALIDRGPARTRSDAEARLLELIRSARLPIPRANARVRGYEVDMYWPDRRVVVEFDSYAWHGKTASAFERDNDKTADLEGAGLDVIRITWKQLTTGRDATIARLARALALKPAAP